MITWTEEEEEGQQQEEELVVVLLVTKKREKEQWGAGGNRKERKAAWMAEHVRFHMTSVPVSGSTMVIFTVQLQRGRERERKRREMERRSREGAYTPGWVPCRLQAPPPVSAAAISARQRSGGVAGGVSGAWQ